jgi:2'-5' RNA ligase
MKRTFIAIDIPVSLKIKECLKIMLHSLADEKIRWVAENNLHLTIMFLGDTEEQKILGIQAKLKEMTENLPVFSVTIKNVGVFKNFRDPRIIWFGIEENKELLQLKKIVENQIAPFGFLPEARKFLPHMTIGRIKYLQNKKILQQIIEDFQDQVLHQFMVQEVVFYESILGKEGPEYVPLGKFNLKNS